LTENLLSACQKSQAAEVKIGSKNFYEIIFSHQIVTVWSPNSHQARFGQKNTGKTPWLNGKVRIFKTTTMSFKTNKYVALEESGGNY
jgi:hypothetical protein